jgi:hypothetical protein
MPQCADMCPPLTPAQENALWSYIDQLELFQHAAYIQCGPRPTIKEK